MKTRKQVETLISEYEEQLLKYNEAVKRVLKGTYEYDEHIHRIQVTGEVLSILKWVIG